MSPPPGTEVVLGQRTQCFPAAARVRLADGSVRRMDRLRVGDLLDVPGWRDGTDRVLLFTHASRYAVARFVAMAMEGRVLKVTAGHYVHVWRDGGFIFGRADGVVVGEYLKGSDGGKLRVEKVWESVEIGLYNPQTASGDVVVEGVRVSTYTEAVEPGVAHALLVPVRAMHDFMRGTLLRGVCHK